MLTFGAVLSPIQLILVEIFSKLHFGPKICPKWENSDFLLNLRPNGLIFAHNLSFSLNLDHMKPKAANIVFFGVS
jgi:hypothetical protein